VNFSKKNFFFSWIGIFFYVSGTLDNYKMKLFSRSELFDLEFR